MWDSPSGHTKQKGVDQFAELSNWVTPFVILLKVSGKTPRTFGGYGLTLIKNLPQVPYFTEEPEDIFIG